MPTFKFVIKIWGFEEQIIKQLPLGQQDNFGKPTKGEVAWHTHTSVVVPLEERVQDGVQDAFRQPFSAPWKRRGKAGQRAAPTGSMQLFPERLLQVRQDVPLSSPYWL